MNFKDTDYIQSIFNKILDEHNNMSSHLEYLMMERDSTPYFHLSFRTAYPKCRHQWH